MFTYLAYIRDAIIFSPSLLDFVCVVHEFMDVFPTNWLGMPLDCDINFAMILIREPSPSLFLTIGWTQPS